MRSASTTEKLLAAFFEGKFKKAGVRLSAVERNCIRDASLEYVRTNDVSALESAVHRKRSVHIEITDADIDQFIDRVIKGEEEATVIAIQKIARTMASEVGKWANIEVEWTNTVRAGFESRIARTWRKPLHQYSRFLRLVAYIAELTTAHINEKQLLEPSRLAEALLMLHARALTIAGEVEALIRCGFADGATARWRTLHEITVTAAFLVEHGEDTALRYLEHFPCEQLKGVRLYEEHCRALGEEPLEANLLNALKDDVDQLAKRYGEAFRHDNGWAAHALQLKKVTFSDIERSVKLDFMRPYYRGASEQVHASSRGAVMRTGLINQQSTIEMLMAGPSNYGFADAAINSARELLTTTVSLLQVISTVDSNVFSIILGGWLDPLTRSFVEAQHRIEQREERYKTKLRPMRSVRPFSTTHGRQERGKKTKRIRNHR